MYNVFVDKIPNLTITNLFFPAFPFRFENLHLKILEDLVGSATFLWASLWLGGRKMVIATIFNAIAILYICCSMYMRMF